MQFEYVIVGGGSAGSVLAARLSEDPAARVCLVEAGGDGRSFFIRTPLAGVANVATRLNNWAYETEPQPGLGGRRGYQPRGRALGGSSAINAMVYTRGHPLDYDEWAALGAQGWGWADVLPYFKRAENNERGADAWHGAGGPLNVADARSGIDAPVEAFVAAAVEAGFPRNADFNGAEQEGVGRYQVTQKDGRRCSAAAAYLHPVMDRANLTVLTHATAERLIVDGRRCTGVAVRHRGAPLVLAARREVILSAGAFGSPQLLMLSGIGPAAELARHGIALRHELPGVGENLHDHIDYVLAYRGRDPALLGLTPPALWRVAAAWGRYRREGRGPWATNFAEAGGFLRSAPGLDRPDLQLHFVVAMVEDHARRLHVMPGYSCHVCVLRPKSRGRLTLRSAAPADPPRIDPGFLTDEADLALLAKGVQMTADILERPALAAIRGPSLHGEARLPPAELARLVRQRADTVYHPVGTCRMGSDEMAVVDPALRVRGIEGLRVVDASVMPRVIGGNTNAPVIMIAEKAVELIRGDGTR